MVNNSLHRTFILPTNHCSLYVYNKIDSISLEHLDKLAREPHTAVMSCELDLGITDVVDKSWEMLNLIRIYTKRFVSSWISFPSSSNVILIILKERSWSWLLRGPHCSPWRNYRRCLWSNSSDPERPLQVRVGVGREREACTAESRADARGAGWGCCFDSFQVSKVTNENWLEYWIGQKLEQNFQLISYIWEVYRTLDGKPEKCASPGRIAPKPDRQWKFPPKHSHLLWMITSNLKILYIILSPISWNLRRGSWTGVLGLINACRCSSDVLAIL